MLSDFHVRKTVLTTTAGVVLAAVIITTLWQRKKRARQVPTQWRRVGELSELFIYPLKSGAALQLNEAECTDIGIQTSDDDGKLRDRFFIIATEKGVMKTARQHPKMFFIKVTPKSAETIVFTAPDMKDLTVSIPTGFPKKKNSFTMWDAEEVEAVDCGDEAAQWIHSYLGLREEEKVRLGYHQQDCTPRRDFNKKPWAAFRKVYRNLLRFDSGAYSDMAPFLLINDASVKDLNERIPGDKAVVAKCFRPNFVVRGPDALVEDNWDFVKIGDSAVFQNVKPCLRCIMTTMNPETGEKDPDMQPLKTLRSYRLLKDARRRALESTNAPAMGCYMGLRSPGVVRVGDPVYVEELPS